MKKIIGTTLLLALSFAAQAGETFGGIFLDSSLPAIQVRTLKEDFTYLHSAQIKNTDPQFQKMAELSKVDGPSMYNWVYNRIKYIIGQDYNLRGRNLVKKKGHVFPATPVPPSVQNRARSYVGVIIMANMGAELYLTGKLEKVLKGLRLDRKDIFATSPRVGIVQVGEGLFLERLLVNKKLDSEANKIKRLGTIFHEARHGDGHSENVGFIHNECPMGHALSGFSACEASSNGPYSLEAVATKTMLLNCKTCSNEDKTKLSTVIADSYNRVVVRSHVKTEAQLLEEIASYKRVVEFYEKFIATNPKQGEAYRGELEKMRAALELSETQLKELRTPVQPKKLDSKPEGPYEDVSVEKSSTFFKASIK